MARLNGRYALYVAIVVWASIIAIGIYQGVKWVGWLP